MDAMEGGTRVQLQWGIAISDRPRLNAMAMDRGFAHVNHVINVARSFFLAIGGNLAPVSESSNVKQLHSTFRVTPLLIREYCS